MAGANRRGVGRGTDRPPAPAPAPAFAAEPVPGPLDTCDLDLRQLRHFLAIVEAGHFASAARRLGISKQGISQSVAALEQELGVRLFERGQFGAVPTEFGRVLEQHAKAICAETRKAREELASLREQHRGEVTFAVGASFAEFVAPPAISRFRAAHPRVVLKIANVHPDNMLPLLVQGELDFVAMGELQQLAVADLERQPLFRMDNHLLMAADHPLAARRSLELADLCDQTFVGVWRHPLTAHTLATAFETAGCARPAVVECDNLLVTRGLVLDEGCLVIANRLFFEREFAAGSLVQREVRGLSYEVTYALYRRRSAVLGRATGALMDEIHRVATERFAGAARHRALPGRSAHVDGQRAVPFPKSGTRRRT